MIRRIVSLGAVLMTLIFGAAWSAEMHGDWNAELSKDHPGKLYVSVEIRRSDQHGSVYEFSDFTDLTLAEAGSKSSIPVRFELRREPGRFVFEGTFRDGKGLGEFVFFPSADYPRRLGALGVRFEPTHGDRDHELLELALFDVSTGFIRSMQAVGYDEPLDKYIAFRIFQVDPPYVRDMRAVGFDHLSADKLIETRIHGATPGYIRQARSDGQDLSLDGYIQARIFQITPEYEEKIARAGYPGLDHEKLLQFRIQGVTPEFIGDLRDLGYSSIPADKLVEMRIFGVTPSYIRRVNQGGSRHVPIDDMIQRRIGY